MLKGKTVLITGGTGSFGKAMLHRILREDVREVRIFSRDELKQEEMRVSLRNPRVKFYIGDVRDRTSIDIAMPGVDMVFHAAALKQVPSCEFFPMQAVMTNVQGSHNVIESAIAHSVRSLVCLSTDKAAYPINAMGISKAMMEKVAQAAARRLGQDQTIVSCVRYGNVMYSRGSVIPLFIQQIKSGKPITITDARMTRFLLSLQDAIELVLHAFREASQGDLFIRKAPACTVGDLATALQNIFGSSAPIKSIGIRHGEKMFETLATMDELVRSEDMGDYLRISMDDRDLNYDKYFTEGALERSELQDYTSHNTTRLSLRELEALLRSLPELHHEASVWKAA